MSDNDNQKQHSIPTKPKPVRPIPPAKPTGPGPRYIGDSWPKGMPKPKEK